MTRPLPPSMSRRTKQRDSYYTGMAVMLGVVVLGFVAIALGKRSLARTTSVDLELPGLVSGCIAGILLIALGAGLAVGLHSRRLEADLRADTDDVQRAAQRLLAATSLMDGHVGGQR